MPKFEAFTNYDDSIAYTTANVKNLSEKEKIPSGGIEKDEVLLPVEITQDDIDILRTLEPT